MREREGERESHSLDKEHRWKVRAGILKERNAHRKIDRHTDRQTNRQKGRWVDR